MVGDPAAVPARRSRRRRLPRRLHQDRQAAQPRPSQQGEDGRPDRRRHRVRLARADAPRRARRDPGERRALVHPRDGAVDAAGRARRAALPGDDHRVQQRGEPHRRPRRPRHRRVHDGVRRLHAREHLAEQPVLRDQRRAEVLRGARSPRPRGHRGRPHRRLFRLPVVERLPGQDLHGRHRLARPRRRAGGPRHPDPHRVPARDPRRPVRDHHVLGHPPGRLLQAQRRQADLPDGPAPAPLRAQGVGGDHDRDPLLDHHRPVRRRRARSSWPGGCATPSTPAAGCA